MNKAKSDYLRGLLHFLGLTVCVCLFFTTPDGDTLFYELLGLFGISPGIPIGTGGMLYIYMLAPQAAGIFFAIKAWKYWKNYREKFKGIHALLRLLPVFIVVLIYSAMRFLHPSVIERAYYTELSQRGGLSSVACYAPDYPFQYRTDHTGRTYTYVFTLANYSDESLQFNVELTAYKSPLLYPLSDALVKDEHGQSKVFTLAPMQIQRFIGEFTDPQYNDTRAGNGFSIALIAGGERYEPDSLAERPEMFVPLIQEYILR